MGLSQVEKDRAKDKRLQRKFGITLAEHHLRAAEQNFKCKICGGPLDAYGPPHVDHFHFFVKVDRFGSKPFPPTLMKWVARAFDELDREVFMCYGETKEQASDNVKKRAAAWSVRGLLCFKCNRGLGCIERFFNAAAHPENLLPVIEYLKARLKP